MIPVKNIYHMLSYVFTALKKSNYENVETTAFASALDLYAELLSIGITEQRKRGLNHAYVETADELSVLRGRLDLTNTMRPRNQTRRKLACIYEEFSVDSQLNRILKATMRLLCREKSVNDVQKKKLRQLLPYFGDVESIDVRHINWKFRYDRNNQSYRMLIGICYLIVTGCLQTTDDGSVRLMAFNDEKIMSWLYEHFILAYYQKKHFHSLTVRAEEIKWQVSPSEANDSALPNMRTDVTLRAKGNNNVLIIDAKYYTRNTADYYGKNQLHSANLYQIFSYVTNMQTAEPNRIVSGMLLYAKTDDPYQPHGTYHGSGKGYILIRTLDLDCDWQQVEDQLDDIANSLANNIAKAIP